jgi:hypothetical protein
VDILSDASGFGVRSHDLHGPLPEIQVQDSCDTFRDKDTLNREVCKLIAIVRLRERMVKFLPGGEFLPPTRLGNSATAGFRVGSKSWLAEGDNFLAAYHILDNQVIGGSRER